MDSMSSEEPGDGLSRRLRSQWWSSGKRRLGGNGTDVNAALLAWLAWLLPLSEGEPQRSRDANCVQSPLMAQLDTPSGKALLRLYGYDLDEIWACDSIASSLAPGTQILRFRKVSKVSDDFTAFTVMKVANRSAL